VGRLIITYGQKYFLCYKKWVEMLNLGGQYLAYPNLSYLSFQYHIFPPEGDK